MSGAAPSAAVDVAGISKSFRLPHERRTTLREHFVSPLKRMTFETNKVLQDVTFNVARGEFYGIIGPNGSGKSTLLKIIASIYQPDSGTVRVDGKLSPFIELGVGFNDELSARDNVRINATLLGYSRSELNEKFDEIIAFAELERFVDQQLKNYSSGMQVRLAYAIAIQVPFDILLLDEVLAVGDQDFQAKCFGTFEDMRRAGKTLILVTHDLRTIPRFCDRVLLLENGVVSMIGSAEEVVDIYRDRHPGGLG